MNQSRKVLSTLVAVILAMWASGCDVEDGQGEHPTPQSRQSDRQTDEQAGRNPEGRPSTAGKEKDRDGEQPGSSQPPQRTSLVIRIVDGDTLELDDGETVRLVGIDTPELGQCGYGSASGALARMVLGQQVVLGMSDEDRDGYGRLLRYINVGDLDAGLRMIRNGLAIARYDSRDGYGYHPREAQYIAADKGTKSPGCSRPQPLVQQSPGASGNCEPGYTPCVPVYPPDVDCADVNGPIAVSGTDPHGLDGDGDGSACE